jgi:DNA-binding transcriptional MerR regulator
MDTPEKLYYSISEVSETTGVKAYVLRYWESQFSMLRPRKSRGGVRKYRPKDLALVQEIRHLLYDRGFTIAGARRKLLDDRKEGKQVTKPGLDMGPASQPQLVAVPAAVAETAEMLENVPSTRELSRGNKKALSEIRQELLNLKEMLVQNNAARENSREGLNIRS